MYIAIAKSMNDNINMDSTITRPMNDKVSINITMAESMNDNIDMDNTLTG